MAYYINDNCAKCGTCADTCPLGIITEGDDKYVIDADQCVECGSCAAAGEERIEEERRRLGREGRPQASVPYHLRCKCLI